MWLKLSDERGPIFFNLEARLDIKTLTVADLTNTIGVLRPEWEESAFGHPDELLLMLVGPTLTEFEIIASFHPGPAQAQQMAHLNDAIARGLASGERLLDMDRLVAEAQRLEAPTAEHDLTALAESSGRAAR